MKVLVPVLITVVCSLVPTEGGAISLMSDFNETAIKHETPFDEVNVDDQGSTYIHSVLGNIFAFPEWRKLMAKSATPKELTNTTFRARWNITTDRDVTFSDVKEEAKIRAIWKTPPWKGFIALMSTKSELLDTGYRVKWGLGLVDDDVKNGEDIGNFFDSPQWKEFLIVTRTTKNLEDPKVRLKWLRNWILEAMNMMSELYWSLDWRKKWNKKAVG